jgi:hypothetical protein
VDVDGEHMRRLFSRYSQGRWGGKGPRRDYGFTERIIHILVGTRRAHGRKKKGKVSVMILRREYDDNRKANEIQMPMNE